MRVFFDFVLGFVFLLSGVVFLVDDLLLSGILFFLFIFSLGKFGLLSISLCCGTCFFLLYVLFFLRSSWCLSLFLIGLFLVGFRLFLFFLLFRLLRVVLVALVLFVVFLMLVVVAKHLQVHLVTF